MTLKPFLLILTVLLIVKKDLDAFLVKYSLLVKISALDVMLERLG